MKVEVTESLDLRGEGCSWHRVTESLLVSFLPKAYHLLLRRFERQTFLLHTTLFSEFSSTERRDFFKFLCLLTESHLSQLHADILLLFWLLISLKVQE